MSRPSRSQLTSSAFLSQVYDLEDRLAEAIGALQAVADDDEATLSEIAEARQDFVTEVQDIASEIEGAQSECESSLDNIPDHLQEAPTGELLSERIEACESLSSELTELASDAEDADIELSEIASKAEDIGWEFE